jgi:hypothetical protein
MAGHSVGPGDRAWPGARLLVVRRLSVVGRRVVRCRLGVATLADVLLAGIFGVVWFALLAHDAVLPGFRGLAEERGRSVRAFGGFPAWFGHRGKRVGGPRRYDRVARVRARGKERLTPFDWAPSVVTITTLGAHAPAPVQARAPKALTIGALGAHTSAAHADAATHPLPR